VKVGHGIEAKPGAFSFDGPVATTFVDHVRQSVPFYDVGHDLVCALSDYFCHADSRCYELGVSTGQLLRKLAEHHAHKPGIRWVGIDRAEDMIAQAKKHCAGIENVELVVDDVLAADLEGADLIVSYYCVQFVAPRRRQDLFDRVYRALNWGGAFIMFEKVRAPDARFQDMLVTLYNDFKTKNGFSAEEILNKTSTLKGILEPFSTEGNLGLMKRAGFVDVMTVMKYLGFEGFIAIK
jgi:tRNA (cmo5U34)-methyltransferase